MEGLEEKVKSQGWSILADQSLETMIYDSSRDAFMAALAKDNIRLDEATDAQIKTAKEWLISAKGKKTSIKSDEILDEAIGGKTPYDVAMVYSGDAVYIMQETESYKYYAPELTNVWIDGFVIPQNAKNTELAYEFINYLSSYDANLENTAEIGYTSPRNDVVLELLKTDEFKEEIKPKNILMIGPTGVGKTEIARRLSKLVEVPFVKVEATKFTEVGYVGRDVDSMVRDLVEESIRMIKNKKIEEVYEKSKILADEKIVDILLPYPSRRKTNYPFEMLFGSIKDEEIQDEDKKSEIQNKRKELLEKLRRGELDEKIIEIEVDDSYNSTIGLFSGLGMEEFNINMGDIFGDILPKKKKKKKVTIKEARKIISNEEAEKLIDMDEVIELGIKRAEENGMIFIDEIDKIAGKNYGAGPDVSREGVQRDILPIVEGTTVMTKYGPVKTNHILFIAAGAFHVSKVEDLIPEFQGRFPVRVELESLTEENFREILTKPKNALIKQYQHLLKTEGIDLKFTEGAINLIAKAAFLINEQSENIGARRLNTVLEKLLEDISFEAPELDCKEIVIDEEYVNNKLKMFTDEKDITKYIL